MKRKTVVSLIIIVVIVCLLSSVAYAHEIYYTSSGVGIVLKWNYKTSSKLYVTCSNDYLTGTLASAYPTAMAKWYNSCPSTVFMADVTSTTSKMDFLTPTQSYWKQKIGTPTEELLNYRITFAYTELYDTNSLFINTVSTAQASTKRIGSAAVYVNPYPDAFDGTHADDGITAFTADQKAKLLAHELGHVMGLGHCDAVYNIFSGSSIMRVDFYDEASSPAAHD